MQDDSPNKKRLCGLCHSMWTLEEMVRHHRRALLLHKDTTHTQVPKRGRSGLRTPTDSYSSVAKSQTTQLKMHKNLKRHFSKEDIHVANGYRKRCLTLLILQLKIAVNYYLISLKMAIIRKQKK